jgi:SynChlorMet cassette protein ScmD
MRAKGKGPVPNPVAVLREEFDDWAVLFNPDNAKALGINPTGVAVWKAINGSKQIHEIVSDIKDKFSNVPEETVEMDISEFIEVLARGGFVGYELEGTK